MSGRSTILSNYPVVRSSDPECARDRLIKVYGASSFDVKSRRRFAMCGDHLQIGGVGLSYVGYSGDVSVGFDEVSFVRQLFSIGGHARFTTGAREGIIGSGSWSPILPAGQSLAFDFLSDYRHVALRIETDELSRTMGALIGEDVGNNLVFDEGSPMPAAMEALRRRVFHLANDFNECGISFSSLAAVEIARTLVIKFLLSHRHNYTHIVWREPPQSTSATVRIVEEFIEANWHKPIDIEKMVEVAQVSARSLFRQFKKDRGCSPADFAKRVRLGRARELLEQSSADGSVIQVALKCGFQNPGHFARDYRNAFGELPSATLHRARKWLSAP
ncbi:MAG: helix-turn-helix domain-containing protein [Bradyrhizobium sp.]